MNSYKRTGAHLHPLGRHLVAAAGHLRRQRPHALRPHPRRAPHRAARWRRLGQPVPRARRVARRRPRRDRRATSTRATRTGTEGRPPELPPTLLHAVDALARRPGRLRRPRRGRPGRRRVLRRPQARGVLRLARHGRRLGGRPLPDRLLKGGGRCAGSSGSTCATPGCTRSSAGCWTTMLGQVVERGPDSAGVAVYGDRRRCPEGHAAVSVLRRRRRTWRPPCGGSARVASTCWSPRPATPRSSPRRSRSTTSPRPSGRPRPDAVVVGSGTDLTVYKGAGHPRELAATYDLAERARAGRASRTPGWPPSPRSPRRAATRSPSARTSAWCTTARSPTTPRSAASCGRRARCSTRENDSEVGARFVAARLAQGEDLDKALRLLCERFDGFYTLLVTSARRLRRGPRRHRVQARDHRRDPGLGRHGVGVPRPGRAAGHRGGPDLRARAGAGLRMAADPDGDTDGDGQHRAQTAVRPPDVAAVTIDLATVSVRALNAELHAPAADAYEVLHPDGAHAIAAGAAAPDRRSTCAATPATTARA